MSYTLRKINERITITFTEDLEKGEITSAFLEIISTINIKEIMCIVFDCSKAVDYVYPANYMKRVKYVTQFSTSWNEDVHMIFIATNPQIRHMVNGFMNHYDDLKWEYHLYENISEISNHLCCKDYSL